MRGLELDMKINNNNFEQRLNIGLVLYLISTTVTFFYSHFDSDWERPLWLKALSIILSLLCIYVLFPLSLHMWQSKKQTDSL